MSKNLVIVESPGKTKTIEKVLGKDFHVMSSQGHIRDIEGIGKNSTGIDFDNHYQPNYVIDPQKKQLIASLRQEVEKADTIWLASDEDREGEAIAWHLNEVLELSKKDTRRIVFHAITDADIKEAIQHPRQIDYNLVNAQQARRVLDRIVGFELSPVLWRKITTGLSAGRVQSVVVRLVVEREREIEEFKETSQYRVVADFIGKNVQDEDVSIKAELNHRFASKEEALTFLEQCQNSQFQIRSISNKPARRTPAAPFTTSTLQQEATRKLKFPVAKTMRLAQALYEAGKITYMRTDSVNLSSLAIATTKAEIISEYGEKYHRTRQYHTTSKGAQEAHEAIRPTYMNVHSAGANNDEKRLYDLIWKRTIACQMADAQTEVTKIEIAINGQDYIFSTSGEVVVFDGFMRAYIQSNDDETETEQTVLPKMKENAVLTPQEISAQQTFTKPPFRYNEATLVKKMEELGIGRPSTYATIIETIQQRHYVERGNVTGRKREFNLLTLKGGHIQDKQKTETVGHDTQKLLPTDLGRLTNDFLVEQFPEILSYDFTAKEEENFDEIALGHADWVQTVDDFYQTFHPTIKRVPKGKVAGRLLGTDPRTGEPVYAKVSKIGPCIQIGDAEKDKPRFVSLDKEHSLFTITLEEALALFDNSQPGVLCQIDGEDVVSGEGKYGPYLRIGKQFISIPKGQDIHNLTTDQIRELITAQQQKNVPIHDWGEIKVLQGRYGAYIKTSTGNYKIPHSTNVSTLTQEACQQIITSQPEVKNQRFHRKKS